MLILPITNIYDSFFRFFFGNQFESMYYMFVSIAFVFSLVILISLNYIWSIEVHLIHQQSSS